MEKLLKPELFISSFDEKAVRDYIQQLNCIQEMFGQHQTILLHIDSYGGSAYGLIMLYEHVISMGNPIVTYTTSKAMSAGAFLLSMAGSPGMRFASPNSTILVHEIQSGAGGDIKEMEQQMSSIKSLNERILTIFAKSIGLRTAKDVRELIKKNNPDTNAHDLTLTASEAKRLGLIDSVSYVKLASVVGYNLIQYTNEKPKSQPKKKLATTKK